MSFLIKLLAALIPNIIKELLKIKPEHVEGGSDGKTESALKRKIKRIWGKK
jgi:hypothetical protein